MATVKFVQAQKFSLAGSGASIGDTTITLQSMLGINGVALTTTDIGIAGFGTIEPGNGAQEEAIKFTGITQNANGTATLTGVSTVLFISPYTASSGLAKTHAGGVTFILSNEAAFYGSILDYVDAAVSSSGIPATNLVAGISKLSVAAVSAANPIAVGDNDTRLPSAAGSALLNIMATSVGLPSYVAATGSGNAYTASLNPVPVSYVSGMIVNFKVPNTNSSSATLNVNGLGAKSITKNFNASLASGDLISSQVASVIYDGTQFQLVSPQATKDRFANGLTSQDASSTTTLNVAHGLGVIPARVTIYATVNYGSNVQSMSVGVFDNTGQNSKTDVIDGATNTVIPTTGKALHVRNIANSQNNGAVITVDQTNIIFTWSKVGSPAGTIQILWDAFA